MKHLFCLTLTLCLMLCACAGAPAEPSLPAETTAPPETTVPDVDNDMSWQGQEMPIADDPAETTEPADSAPPAEGSSYTLRIDDPEAPIYAGPAFRTGSVAMVGEAGVYTIVEEATDSDGNLWGRLKSGIGWLCLTEPFQAPIHADYAAEEFNPWYAYWTDDTDYITSIGFTASETLTDVSLTQLDWFERGAYTVSQELYTIDSMTPEQPFLAQVCFWGDMTTYGISFTDADGEARHYAISISGKDGSLLCTEYTP